MTNPAACETGVVDSAPLVTVQVRFPVPDMFVTAMISVFCEMSATCSCVVGDVTTGKFPRPCTVQVSTVPEEGASVPPEETTASATFPNFSTAATGLPPCLPCQPRCVVRPGGGEGQLVLRRRGPFRDGGVLRAALRLRRDGLPSQVRDPRHVMRPGLRGGNGVVDEHDLEGNPVRRGQPAGI